MRDITSAVSAQAGAKAVRVGILAQIQFVSTTEYVWSGIGALEWEGNTYLGLGALAHISPVSEDSEVRAQGLALALSGINPEDLQVALTEVRQGLPAKLFLAFFDANNAIIPDPVVCYAGRVDQVLIEEGAESCTITINVENRLADLQRPLVRRYTDQDQRMDYPGDPSFGWVGQLMDWTSSWGAWPRA